MTSVETGRAGWLRRLLAVCLEFPKTVVWIVIVSVTTIAAVVAGPLLTRQGVNDAVGGDTSALWTLGAGLILIAAFDFAGDYLRRFTAGRLSLWVQHRLRGRVFDSIQRLDGPGQDSLRTGQVVSRTNSDLQQVQGMLQMSPVPIAVGSYYVFGITAMLWLSPSLTLIAVSVVAALGFTAWRTRRRVFAASAQAQQEVGEITEHLRSTVSGITAVKSYAQESNRLAWLDRASRVLFARRMRTARAQAAPAATMLALPLLGQAALLLAGGWQVMTDRIDLGTFVAFSTYLALLTGPTRILASFMVIAQRTRASAERVFELIDARPDMRDGADDVPESAGISFERVGFGYTSDSPVLHEVSFAVAPGETVAVVGPSGSGKSTLALLAPRFYDATTGVVRLGDPARVESTRDVRDLRLDDLRGAVGVVFEEPFLFRATVRENIAYGHPEAADADVRAAAAAAGAEGFIEALEHGYDTEVAEAGRNLSGGQRQRIALARALLTRPGVLIVDDATSAVDASTESGINTALRRYASGETDRPRCTLLIARRRSTLELADRIVVLDGGRTVGDGTWEQLERDCPQFRELLAGDDESIDHPVGEHELWPDEESESAPATEPDPDAARLTRLPEAAAAKAADPATKRVLQLVSPVKGLLGAALLLICVSAAANAFVPVLIQRGIDSGVTAGDGWALALCALLAVGVIAVDWFGTFGQNLTSAKGSEAVQYGVRVRSFRQVLGFGLPYFEREQGGQLITRLTVDVDSLAKFLQTGLAASLMSLATMIGVGVAMLVFDPVLALVALSPLPLVLAATVVFRRLSARAYDKARKDIGEVNSSLQENLSGLRVVQAHGKQSAASTFFHRISDRYRLSREQAQRYIALYFPFIAFCSQLSYALALVAGAHFVAAESVSAGVLAAFLLLLGQFFAPIQQLANAFDAYQQARVGGRRTEELLAMPADEEWTLHTAADEVRLSGDIAVRGLGYTHHGSNTPALRGVDLDLPAGTSLALVGATGAGKTTVVKILAGLYEPGEGTVTVAGRDAAGLDRAGYRRGVGTVPQEPQLFDGTVAANIRFARPEATDAEVEAAARAASALDFIATLPRGFHHRVSDGGANLAAGHRQLIALSRAKLARADLLLLDETTAHLDARSEAAVLTAVRDGGRTAVIVAHRLTTAARCDRVAVLDHGRVVESGTHERLLAQRGAYAALWRAAEETEDPSTSPATV